MTELIEIRAMLLQLARALDVERRAILRLVEYIERLIEEKKAAEV